MFTTWHFSDIRISKTAIETVKCFGHIQAYTYANAHQTSNYNEFQMDMVVILSYRLKDIGLKEPQK